MFRPYKYISALLLFISTLFMVVPLNVVHELCCDHHDTVDSHDEANANPFVGKAHTHCDMLQLTSPPFQAPQTTFSFSAVSCCFYYAHEQYNFHCKDFTASQYLRGPPVA